MTLASPVALNTDTWPPEPTLMVTALGMVWPGAQLRLDAFGWGCPFGQIVRNPGAVVPVTVALRTTASALAGTAAVPVTVTWRVVPGPHGVVKGPTLSGAGRLSRMRAGSSGVYPSPGWPS